ncbi:MAG TPA: ABC transporter substrate binding protein [bacterium]|nr:ABC transporter substrate binding protein [bacterium]
MTRRSLPRIALLLALAACGVPLRARAAAPAEKAPVVLLRDAGTGSIFEQAVAGFTHARGEVPTFEVSGPRNDGLVDKVKASNPETIVAFGQQAASFAFTWFPDVPCVVALAERTGAHGAPTWRIELEVTPQQQMKRIAEILPDVQSVGVVYDPEASQGLVNDLAAAATAQGAKRHLSVVPIAARSEKDVPAALRAKIGSIDALLFVPDPTITTDGTVQYLLRETLRASIPAIGFLDAFVANGAVLAIEPDYRAIGEQASAAVEKLKAEHADGSAAPERVRVVVNTTVTQKLGLRANYDRDRGNVTEYQR